MPPRTSARLPGLDTLRALAILLVLVYHLAYALPPSLYAVGQFGWMGVDLFFVLSGYLIGSQMLRERLRTGSIPIVSFYRRRAFRILPAYLVVLALYLFVPQWREQPGLAPWWKFVTFTENLLFHPEQRAFSHVWSLCVEEHFYLVLPLLVAALMRRPPSRFQAHRTATLIAIIVLGGIGLRAYALFSGAEFMARIYYPTYMRLDGLVAGVSLAIIRTFRPTWWNWLAARGHATMLSGLCLIAPVLWMFHGDTMGDTADRGAWGMIVGLPMLALGIGLLVASSVSRNGLLSRRRIPGAQPLALLAFSLYLTHKAAAHVLGLVLPTLTHDRDTKAIALYAAACLIAAVILYLWVERPFLTLRDRLDHRILRQTAPEKDKMPTGGSTTLAEGEPG